MPAETDAIQVHQTNGLAPFAFVPGLGKVTNTFAIVGPSPANEKTFFITGFQLGTPIPAVVLLQPRQSVNQDMGFHDVFAVQVIETAMDYIKVHIKRLDSAYGWGQDLRLDILIIEHTNN